MATITKRKTGAWQARIRRHGYPEQIKTFDRKRDAADWSRDIETAMKSGQFDESTESKRNTVADMIDRFLKGYFHPNRRKGAVVWRGFHAECCQSLASVSVSWVASAARSMGSRSLSNRYRP